MFPTTLALTSLACVLLLLGVEATYMPEYQGSNPGHDGMYHPTPMPGFMYKPLHKYNMARLAEAREWANAQAAKAKAAEEARPKRRNLLVGRYGFRIGKRSFADQDYSRTLERTSDDYEH